MENHNTKPHSKALRHILVVIFTLLPGIYAAIQWSNIPDTIPVHFNAAMQPDRYGSKMSIWFFVAIMSGVTLLTYLLVTNLHKIDPKRTKADKSATYNKLITAIVVFLVMIQFTVVMKAIHPEVKMLDRLTYPLVGLLFVFMGNYLYNIKPNYFVGIRFPWTLASDYNWRKTHRLGGTLFFLAGLLIIPVSFMAPLVFVTTFFLTVVAVLMLILIAYSYNIFRKEHKNAGYYDKEDFK